MKKYLVRLLKWLLEKLTGQQAFYVPCLSMTILPAALKLCQKTETELDPATGGEYKRRIVYSALQKVYPRIPKYALAMSIELAMQKIKGEE